MAYEGISKRRFQTKACISAAKLFLFLFNIIFWVNGLILLLVGFWMRMSITKYFDISREYHFAFPAIFMVTGVAIIIIGFFACNCISSEKANLLYMLAFSFFVIFLLVTGSGISGYVYRDSLKRTLHSGLNATLTEYGHGGVVDGDLDRVQTYLKCCGVDSYRDWFETQWANSTQSVPDSCCVKLKNCHNQPLQDESQIFDKGCYNQIMELLTDNLQGIGLGMLTIAIFQLVGVALACCLAKNINNALYEEMS